MSPSQPRLTPPLVCAAAAAFQLALPPLSPADLREDVGFREVSERIGARSPLPLISYVVRGDSGWHFRKGLSEPTAPASEWRSPEYALDATWEEAVLPIGYGDDDDNTVLRDMRRAYQSIYLRKQFMIEGTPPTDLLLRVYADDGAVVWINGTEVARMHVPDGELAHDAAAFNHEAAWERRILTGADSYLVSGTNTIAAHALNQSATSSDFSFDLELVSPRVTVAQVEASTKVELPPDSGNFEKYFLPEAFSETLPGGPVAVAVPERGEAFGATGDFAGTLIRVQTVTPSVQYGVSTHARTVGANLYGTANSSYPHLPELECYEAGDWLNRVIATGSRFEPSSGAEWIQNHSWIETVGDDMSLEETEDALLRIDYAIERDSMLSIVGLNNGADSTVPPLMATAYNVISVGLTNGEHSRGGTTAGFFQPGRMKPELVAPHTATSYSTAAVSSAAAFLLDEVFRNLSTYASAARPEVMKAILMAGATQAEFTDWRRETSMPFDPVFGAGELNLSRSHHILTRATLQAAESANPVIADWAADEQPAGASTIFSIQIPQGLAATRTTAALCWNRNILNASTNGEFNPEPSLPDMSLTLTSAATPETIIESSAAPVGNVEYIVTDTRLPSGEYLLQVTSDLRSPFGIAWILETELVQVVEPKPAMVPRLQFVFQDTRMKILMLDLIPGETYRLEQSSNLTTWTAVYESVAETNASDWEPQTVPDETTFYRLLLLGTAPANQAPGLPGM